ncbi:DUF305 domain-containing protein [Streptomyces sp. ATexAB-D23]|uniref:DUF305 domain-containing protein n=1 Tax=unclassified Streptomyces TaxID=2593676 RepID=UPI000379148E|nr:DUF305 domain-containing protein [Streptomyces sp. ATexAB-D23]MYY07203.1 DUF305 domain-containing protein [Streptomyces sp. SID4913]
MKKAARGTAALLLLLLAAGCAAPADERRPPAPAAASRASGGPASAPPASGAPADPTDAAWVQLMTPMNEQAVALLSLAPARSGDAGVRSWAAGLLASQNGELARLRRLLAQMGLPDTNIHEGHDMPGMVTADDLARARTVEGAAFDRFLVAQMKDHLTQSAQVSRSETGSGTRQDAKRLAAELVKARRTELAALPALAAGSG